MCRPGDRRDAAVSPYVPGQGRHSAVAMYRPADRLSHRGIAVRARATPAPAEGLAMTLGTFS